MSTETLVNLDPNDIYVRSNVRFKLLPFRIDALKDNILQAGGVRTPITVEKLSTPIEGKNYALVVGGYRTAAVAKANTEGAGLTLPARVVPEMTDAERLLVQVSENNDRENMNPMDKASAIKQMLDAQITKMDIRKAFAAPGGRKGIKVSPASNSHINMLLSFLDFPKAIQNKLADGVLGMGSAYQLTKQPKDKWDSILERAEAERQKQLDTEERDENAFLKQSQKAEETEQEQNKTAAELETIKAEAEAAKKLAEEKAIAVSEALKTRITAKGEERKKATEHYKATEQEFKAAQQIAEAKEKELGKVEEKAATAAEKAAAAKERLEAARKAKAEKAATGPAKAPKAVSGADIKKAAAKEDGGKAVKLNAGEMREAIKSLEILSGSKNPKTAAVGTLILQCFDGKITDGQLQLGIARLLGEEKMPTQPAPTAAKKK